MSPVTDTSRQRTARQWYTMGWNYSARGTGDLEHGDAMGYPDAWDDGYTDMACGWPKWDSAERKGY